MPKNKKNKWNFQPLDLMITILPSIFIFSIFVIYFLQLNMHLDMLTFLISPIFITYFVIRNVRLGSHYNWMDWFSIIQYSILFLIGFYSVCQYFQKLHFSPVVNAAIFLGLTGFILIFIVCVVFYCLLYKFERVALSKRLYEKQLQASYDIYRECYQLFQEVKNFISFSYKLTALPPQEKSAKEKIRQKYAQMLTVQKNILAKKQAHVDVCKFYLSQSLQSKINQLFQFYNQLFVDCPTIPEEIKKYEEVMQQLQVELEVSISQELGVDFLYKEIQLAIKLNRK